MKNNELSRAKAQSAFLNGKKISHKHFIKGEYIQLNDNKEMVDESGIILNKLDFWLNRTGKEQFDFGWFIVD